MLKIITLLGLSSLALFADDSKSGVNMEAMIMFFAFIIGTMGITKWAASKTKSASDFYTAGGGITGRKNTKSRTSSGAKSGTKQGQSKNSYSLRYRF